MLDERAIRREEQTEDGLRVPVIQHSIRELRSRLYALVLSDLHKHMLSNRRIAFLANRQWHTETLERFRDLRAGCWILDAVRAYPTAGYVARCLVDAGQLVELDPVDSQSPM